MENDAPSKPGIKQLVHQQAGFNEIAWGLCRALGSAAAGHPAPCPRGFGPDTATTAAEKGFSGTAQEAGAAVQVLSLRVAMMPATTGGRQRSLCAGSASTGVMAVVQGKVDAALRRGQSEDRLRRRRQRPMRRLARAEIGIATITGGENGIVTRMTATQKRQEFTFPATADTG